MATKRFDANPQLAALAGSEIIPATSIAGGTDAASNPVAAGSDIKITVQQLFGMEVHAVVLSSGVATVDCGHGMHRNHTLTLTGNATLAVSNLAPAGLVTEFEVQITQDATGSRTLTLPGSFKALGGSDTAISTSANSVTILSAKTFDGGTTWRYAMQESA